MPEATQLTDITKVLQLSLAPVFLLTAIAAILNLLGTRLARIVDRGRALNDRIAAMSDPEKSEPMLRELERLIRRRQFVNRALTAGTSAALLVCALIVTAFVGAMLGFNASYLIAGLFILVMAAVVITLVMFLREVLLSSSEVHFDLRIAVPGRVIAKDATKMG